MPNENKAVYLLSLGCDKNLVDGEVMLGLLREAGHTVSADPEQADAIIVNTCGFIQDAVKESIETVLKLASFKQADSEKILVVTGCMAQRYKDEILKEIPEVDAVLGVGDFAGLMCVLKDASSQPPVFLAESEEEDIYARRMITMPSHVAYVKIAEGCDSHCTYCTIPSIRGCYRSRAFEAILKECAYLVSQGIKELVLVAQDTALYGTDRYGKPRLHELLKAIAALEALVWVRVLYVYPEHITPELIEAIADTPKICPYLDIPIQHSHDAVLKRMGRASTNEKLRLLVGELRCRIPDISLRTTVMAGFPGETEEEFENLCQFIQDIQFDRLGIFAYSKEEGTPASLLKPQITVPVKKARVKKLKALQQQISLQKQQALIGQTLWPVMVDGQRRRGGKTFYYGRSCRDAFELDGAVIFPLDKLLISGDLVAVTVTESDVYDVKGVLSHEPAQ